MPKAHSSAEAALIAAQGGITDRSSRGIGPRSQHFVYHQQQTFVLGSRCRTIRTLSCRAGDLRGSLGGRQEAVDSDINRTDPRLTNGGARVQLRRMLVALLG